MIIRQTPCNCNFCNSTCCQSDGEVSDDCPCSHHIGMSSSLQHSHRSKNPRATEIPTHPITAKNNSNNIKDDNDIIERITKISYITFSLKV